MIKHSIHELQAAANLADDYDKLITYLIDGCSTEIEKVRSIFIWMAHQNITTSSFKGVPDSDTPKGFMKQVNADQEPISTFFAILCR